MIMRSDTRILLQYVPEKIPVPLRNIMTGFATLHLFLTLTGIAPRSRLFALALRCMMHRQAIYW